MDLVGILILLLFPTKCIDDQELFINKNYSAVILSDPQLDNQKNFFSVPQIIFGSFLLNCPILHAKFSDTIHEKGGRQNFLFIVENFQCIN